MSWIGKRTHNRGDTSYYENVQANTYADFLNQCSDLLKFLDSRKAYMANDFINGMTGAINGNIARVRDNRDPALIRNIQSYYYWKRLRRQTGHTYDLNLQFNSQMDALRGSLNTIKQTIEDYTQANCDNPYTLIPADPNSPLNNCSVQNLQSQFQDSISSVKQISQSVVNNLTQANPQYQTAVAMNDTLTNYSNWNWKNPLFAPDTRFSENGLATVTNTYDLFSSAASAAYNSCTNEQTLISDDSTGKPSCLNTEYDLASNTCAKAKSQSQIYEYSIGTEKLTTLWNSVTNSIQGNTLEANRTTLTNANNECTKWVKMFNLWEKLEEEAAASPCEPERPIQTTYDQVMLKMAEDWNRSATLYIESLMKRLAIIQKYTETYPNILRLEANDVTLGPASLGSSMQLKYKVNQITPGVAPVQYLEMLIPNGAQGKQGPQGETGLPGVDGKYGAKGKDGQPGNPTLPTSYN